MGGYVYFVAAEHSERIKIGFCTGDPRRRLYGLQTGSPEELLLVCYVPASMQDERDLHEAFRADRDRGEWFRYSKTLAAFLTHLTWWTFEDYCETLKEECPDCLLDYGDGSEPLQFGELMDAVRQAGVTECYRHDFAEWIRAVTLPANHLTGAQLTGYG